MMTFRTSSNGLKTMSRGVIGAALLIAATAGTSASGQTLAYSEGDFGGMQGFKGWYYGYFDGSSATPWRLGDFEQLPIFDGVRWRREDGAGGFWTSVDPDGGHPNGIITSGERLAEENWAVRRWVSDGTYVLRINGRIWDTDPTPGHGNGVIGHIMVDGETIWSATIENGNQNGIQYVLDVCAVLGTTIDYVIDPRDGNDLCDSTGFHSWIRTVIVEQPQDSLTCTGGAAEFSVVTMPGNFTYQWRHNGVPIQHDATMPRYRVVNASDMTTGLYDCVVSSECGSMVSDAARLTVCDADFDCDGFVDSQDFFTFLNEFFVSTERSDLNHDGFFDTQDYFTFLTLFFNGCDPV